MFMIIMGVLTAFFLVVSLLINVYGKDWNPRAQLISVWFLAFAISFIVIGDSIVRSHNMNKIDYYESIVPKEQHYEYRKLKLSENVQVTVEKECE